MATKRRTISHRLYINNAHLASASVSLRRIAMYGVTLSKPKLLRMFSSCGLAVTLVCRSSCSHCRFVRSLRTQNDRYFDYFLLSSYIRTYVHLQ